MKLLKDLSYNKGFEKWDSPYHFQDYNTLYSKSMFYFSDDQYLKKYFSKTDFSFRFVKDFFKNHRDDAKNYFINKLSDTDFLLYIDKKTNNFIWLSNEMVYENYIYLFEGLISQHNWKEIRYYSKDDLISQDVYCFITEDKKVLNISVSLAEETVSFAFGEIYNNQLYLFPNDDFSLRYDEFKLLDIFIENNLLKARWREYFYYEDVSLTQEEFVKFLKTSGMAKVRSGVVSIIDDYLYDSYMSDILPNPVFSLEKSDFYTSSLFTVGAILYFINLLLHRNCDFNLKDVYWFYRKVLTSELYNVSGG